MTHGIVRIHPEKALLLARATDATAGELSRRAARCAALLQRWGEAPEPASALARAASALHDESRSLRSIVGRVQAWEASGDAPPGVVIGHAPLTWGERRPAEAWRAATAAVEAYRSGSRGRAVTLMSAWLDDPVFAWAVLRRVGSSDLVRELDGLAYAWGTPAQAERGALVATFAALLATTTREGTPAFSVRELARVARRDGYSLGVLGLLFVRCDRWSAGYLVSLVDEVLVPFNRDILGGVAPETALFGSPREAIDGRTLMLRAVAADLHAARRVLRSSDLVALLDAEVGYADGGAALAAALLTGTMPVAGSWLGGARAAMTRLVRSAVAVERWPSSVEDRLGEVAAPWVGSFGSWDFGRPAELADPLGALDRGAVGSFLSRVMRDERAAADVWAATWAWSGAALGALGPAPSAVDAKRVADVLRRVTDASHAGRAAGLAADDADVERRRARWNIAVAVAAGMLPGSALLAGATSGVATVVGGEVLEATIPGGDEEREYLRSLPQELARDQRSYELFTLAVLWEQRSMNGLFAQEGEAHRAGQAASLEGSGLLDGDGHVEYATGDRAGRDAFDAWLLDQNRRGARVAALLDAVGEEFGKSGDD
jgi:hypothetical protein